MLVVLLWLTILTAPVVAQTAYVHSPTNLDEESAPYADAIRQTLELALVARGWKLAERDSARLEVQPVARALPPRAFVGLQARDAATGLLVGSSTVRARTNVTIFTSLNELVEQIDPELAAFHAVLKSGDESVLGPRPLAETILLPGLPRGVKASYAVNGLPIDERTRLAIGSEFDVRFERDRHYPETTRLTIDSTEVSIRPPTLFPKRETGIQFHTSSGRGVGVGMGWRLYFLPDRLFGALETHTAVSGFTGGGVFAHNEIRILAGVGLNRRDARVRWVASTGVGAMVTQPFHSFAPGYTDMYWNVINLSPELRIGASLWFMRVGYTYAFEGQRTLLENRPNAPGVVSITMGVVRLW